jgi:hypothetical protein
MKRMLPTLAALVLAGLVLTPGEAPASYTGPAAGMARATPNHVQDVYWVRRCGYYGCRLVWVRPYYRPYRPYVRRYYRPYYGGYSY